MGEAGSYCPVPVRSRLQRYATEPPALATSKWRVTVSPTVRVIGAVRPSTLTAVTARAGGLRASASSRPVAKPKADRPGRRTQKRWRSIVASLLKDVSGSHEPAADDWS